nr:MAG TPA: hypothetical protein [Caudoviricetes sp.]
MIHSIISCLVGGVYPLSTIKYINAFILALSIPHFVINKIEAMTLINNAIFPHLTFFSDSPGSATNTFENIFML